jgi:hypothetical protein
MGYCKKTSIKSYILSLAYSLIIFAGVISCTSNVQAGTLYAVRESDDTLVNIDTDTFAYTVIGPLGVSFEFGGLTYDPNSQTLYMIGGRGNNNLYTVNRTTGQATLVGSHGMNDLFGLAFDSTNNVLYATQFAGGTNFYSLNTSNGASTLIGNMGIGIGGLAYNSATATLIGVNDGSGALYSINRTNATITLVSNGSGNNDSGLEYDPDKNLYWDIDWSGYLRSYDIDNSFAVTIHLSSLGSHDGLAYVSTGVSTGSISGTITYTGHHTSGNLKVSAFDGAGCGDGTSYDAPDIPISGSGTYNYTISGLPLPGTYVVCAYIDLNNNSGPPEPGEPSGEYFGTVSASVGAPNPTGIDFSLSDPATAVPSMTEWGMIIFMSLAGLGTIYYIRRQKREDN